jgi:hypothetical protein
MLLSPAYFSLFTFSHHDIKKQLRLVRNRITRVWEASCHDPIVYGTSVPGLGIVEPNYCVLKVKVKVVLVHTMKAYRGCVGSMSLILSLSTRCMYFYLLIVLIV